MKLKYQVAAAWSFVSEKKILRFVKKNEYPMIWQLKNEIKEIDDVCTNFLSIRNVSKKPCSSSETFTKYA